MTTINIEPQEQNLSLQAELVSITVIDEPALTEMEIDQIETMQAMFQGEIASMQSLLDDIDPEMRDEYQSLISNLQSGNAILGAAIAKPTSRNINAARGVMKNNFFNAAASETAILSDDMPNNSPPTSNIEQKHEHLSDAAFEVLQVSQINMERKIRADDVLFQHADAVLLQNMSVKLDDSMLDDMLMQNALQSLPYENRKIIAKMSGGDSSSNRLNKMIDGFVSEGLVSIECLNDACAVISDDTIKDDAYAKQIVAMASMVTALQVGKILVSEYMEMELRKSRDNSIDFQPKTIIENSSVASCGFAAQPPELAEQWFLHKPQYPQ